MSRPRGADLNRSQLVCSCIQSILDNGFIIVQLEQVQELETHYIQTRFFFFEKDLDINVDNSNEAIFLVI